MKRAIKNVLAWPVRMVSPRLRRRAVRVAMHAAASRAPADALRELLAIDEDVTGAINELALAYGGGIHAKHRLIAYHDFFVERIRGAGQRVLDVGCGYGAVAYSIATRTDARVTGLDMSAAQVERARARFRHPRLTFVVGTAPDSLPPGPFDIVVASNVLEHVDNRAAFLRGIQETLAPRCWLIRVPMADRDWMVPLRKELGVRHFSDPTHFTEYTRSSFDAEVRDAGFEVDHLQINWGEIWAEVSAIRS